MDRLQTAMLDIQRALDDQKRQVEDARKREAELEVALEAEREAHRQRESALLNSNASLCARVEELSATVARLQAEVVDLTRRMNQSIMQGGQVAMVSVAGSPRPMSVSGAALFTPAHTLQHTYAHTLTRTNGAPSTPGGSPDADTVIASLDRSLEGMRVSAAADLEKYTARLMSRLRPGTHTHTHTHAASQGQSQSQQQQPGGVTDASSVSQPLPNGSMTSALLQAPSERMSVTPPHTHTHTHTLSAEPDTSARGAATSDRGLQDTGITSAAASPAPSFPVFETSTVLREGDHRRDPAAAGSRTQSGASARTAGSTGRAPVAPKGAAAPSGYAAKAATRKGAPASTGKEPPAATATPSRPEVRAAPYDELRMQGGARGPRTQLEPITTSAEEDEEDAIVSSAPAGRTAKAAPGRKAAPVKAAAPPPPISTSTPSAPAASTLQPPKGMSAMEFFSLLRTYVAPMNLEALLGALAMFNQSKLSKTELMTIAQRALQPPAQEHGQSSNLPPAPFDLMAAFEAYLRRE